MPLDENTLLDVVSLRARQSTIAILAYQGGQPKQHGTGTLFRFGGEFFLVTAAHVLTDAMKAQVPLLLAPENEALVPLKVAGAAYTTEFQSDLGSEDPYDIAVWNLVADTVEKIGKKQFLNQTDLQFDADISKGRFLVFGYPSAWSNTSSEQPRTIEQAPISLITIPYDGRRNFERYDDRFHMLLRFSRETTQPAVGNSFSLPETLEGISGCSIWKLHDESFSYEDWTAEAPKVVAIQTCVYSGRGAIRGTLWEGVLTIIAKEWPELRLGFHILLRHDRRIRR
ncbi:MAG: hypothetical protein SGJ19_23890 [Planctomycetia bacterium]|nr:hypothetical protein [Planctomycetia bacterium]